MLKLFKKMGLVAILVGGSSAAFGYQLTCGDSQSANSPHAKVTIDSQTMTVEILSFVSAATWFVIDLAKNDGLPLAYFDPHYAMVKLNFSVPLQLPDSRIEWKNDTAKPDLFSARATTLDGDYTTIPVNAKVSVSRNFLPTREFTVPIRFFTIERNRGEVRRNSAFGTLTHQTESFKLTLGSGELNVDPYADPYTVCSAQP